MSKKGELPIRRNTHYVMNRGERKMQDAISAYGTGKEGELGKNAEENAGGLGRLPDLWLCRCDCGNVCVCQKENLRDGKTKSCGCFRNETRQKNMRKAIHFVDGTLGPSLRFMRRCRRG